MLDDATLLGLLDDLESDRVERKASFGDPKKVRQAVCAFANDLPGHGSAGVVFIGANDDGSCAVLTVTDELLLNLAGMRSDGNILPPPLMSVRKVTLRGSEMAVVEVEPSASPPVRYKGVCWVRVGPRRATATVEEEHRLAERRRWSDLPYDQQPLAGCKVSDLDLRLFEQEYLPSAVAPEILAENERSREQQLAALRFLSRSSVPNVAAAILFCSDPRDWVPGAYVQFVRYDGPEITDPIRDQKEVVGPLSRVLLDLDNILRANISVGGVVGESDRELREPEYPLAALQQLLRNAVMHRSYEGTSAPVRCYWFSDRIEIHNAGGLYGQVTRENFGNPGVTDYRNPLLAEAMKVLGFVQRFGMGIPLARKELEQNGNPPPEFEFGASNFLAVVRRRP